MTIIIQWTLGLLLLGMALRKYHQYRNSKANNRPIRPSNPSSALGPSGHSRWNSRPPVKMMREQAGELSYGEIMKVEARVREELKSR